MKVVDISQLARDPSALVAEVESGEEVVIARDGKPVARLTQPVPFERTPGIAVDYEEVVVGRQAFVAEDVVTKRDGTPVARLTQPQFERTPGIAADHPGWKDFRYDPSIFKPLETDEELRAEGWEV